MARIELIAIGDELLLGDVVDTNATWLGQRLAAEGIRVVHRATVGDDVDAIVAAIRDAHRRTGAVICTGGLGPTRDDLTRDALAIAHDAPLELRDAWLEELQRRYALRGIPMPASNRVQALVPAGGRMLPNPRGTAPGIVLLPGVQRHVEQPGSASAGVAAADKPHELVDPATCLTIALPGVPAEMRGLMEEQVIPLLKERLRPDAPVRSWTLRTTGISEAGLAERVDDIAADVAAHGIFTLAFLPATHGVDLRLTTERSGTDDAATALLARLRERLGVAVYADSRVDLADVVGALLKERGLRLAAAESCTGGLVCKRLTDPPGASEYLLVSFITYSNEAKQRQLNVSAATLEQHGAVSEQCAREMAVGALDAGDADVAVSITGIAGPGGGSEEKPVGLVWFAVAVRSGDAHDVVTHRAVFAGDRDDVRQRAAQMALDMVRRALLAQR